MSGSATALHPSGTPGLTKREFVAALVMAGMLTAGVPRGESRGTVLEDCAEIAVSAADALIERFSAD